MRQLLAESLALALSGGLLGIGLAFMGLRLFQSTFPTGSLPYWFDLRPSASVLMVVAFVCLGTVLVFSLVPAMHTSRASLQPLLTEYGRGGTEGWRARRWTTVFLSAQLGLAFVLIISALLALVGLNAVTAHAVSHQIRELGVRAALGAGPRRLGWFVVRRAIWNIVLGVVVGAGLTFAWVRFFADSPVLGIGLLDPWTLGITAMAILFVGITCAKRASQQPVHVPVCSRLRQT